jgi:iron(III) transport system ATP-binding protein
MAADEGSFTYAGSPVDTSSNRKLRKYRRDQVGFVVQYFALIDDLNVFENVALSLRYQEIPRREIKRRVKETLKLLGIESKIKAYPNELSGGQQQRVALARAFVIEPSVLLMDEPLSNLDAKLRVQMRTTIKKLQRRLGITTVYVTHDQEEALAISDRIAVMNQGNIMQIGTPDEIYRKPANPFVANFIGVSNFIDCTTKTSQGKAEINLPGNYTISIPVSKEYDGEAILSARPEQLFFDEKGIPGKISMSVFLGDFIQYEVELVTGQTIELNEYTKDVSEIRHDGDEVFISMNPAQVSLYEKESKEVLSC